MQVNGDSSKVCRVSGSLPLAGHCTEVSLSTEPSVADYVYDL